MKAFYYAILAAVLALTASCRQSLPEDSSAQFGAKVVKDLYEGVIQLPLSDISTIHKVSAWMDSAADQNARYEIENNYFSKIALRPGEGEVTVIDPNSEKDIVVSHNNISVIEAGAVWSIAAESSVSTKKITLSNVDGDKWLCTQEEPNGDVSLTFEVEWNGIDQYVFTVEGSSSILYANTPVAAQRFESKTKLAARSPYIIPYPIGSTIAIIDGTSVVSLLSETGEVIEGDDIEVTFDDQSEQIPYYSYSEQIPYYSYSEPFNPLIKFRGKSFYYNDIYSVYYYE